MKSSKFFVIALVLCLTALAYPYLAEVGKDWLITGATIENSTIGASTPAAVTGTTVTGSSLVSTGAVTGTKFTTTTSSSVSVATVTLTAAQIKALYTTAIDIIPAQGAGTVIEVLGCTLYYNYSGGACTIGSATNLALKYVDKSGTACSGTIAVTGLLDQTADMSAKILPAAVAASAVAVNVNVPVCLTLAGADVTGAAVTSTLTCKVVYAVHPTGF